MPSKYVVGGYFGNPNGNDAAAEADFEKQFNSFVSTMGGAKPLTMNAFVDFSHDPSTWAANAGWTAWSWTQSPLVTASITPDIGIPMSDNSHWEGNAAGSTNDDFFKGIINGTYDSAYKGVVDAWANAGFKTFNLRLGYEMNGTFMPWFMGSDASTQADWVKAFQHLSTLMRDQAKTDGVTAKIEWNPNNQAWNNQSVVNAYPGDAYVDIVSLDTYSPVYPGGLYNWAKNDGSYNANATEWAADPVNRAHFWSYPDADEWNPTGTGSGFGMENAIAFAKAHGKALAISETGAGNNGTTTGPVDDPAFPKWLASELDKAQSQGVKIDHVNIWDREMGDGNWNFAPDANKPLEAAAWGQYFGANSGGSTSGGTAGGTTGGTTGGGTTSVTPAKATDTLVLRLSEDAWQGDAQCVISIDGKTLGGTVTVTASHAQGKTQTVTLTGQWGPGAHDVGVQFLNDAWGGSAATDRNLYVDRVVLDGQVSKAAPVAQPANGTAHVATGASPLVLHLSEDAYAGHAQFTVSVDGKSLGLAQTVSASHATGQAQNFAFAQAMTTGTHDVAVSFLNDAYGGSATTDRNLYVQAITANGATLPSTAASLLNTSTQHFAITVAPHA
jgi:hypothetical protein